MFSLVMTKIRNSLRYSWSLLYSREVGVGIDSWVEEVTGLIEQHDLCLLISRKSIGLMNISEIIFVP